MVADFLEALWLETGGVRGVSWTRDADPEERDAPDRRVREGARAAARHDLVWREGSGDDESYNFSTPVIEGPQRAMSLLYALARGHALVHGRGQLTWRTCRSSLGPRSSRRRTIGGRLRLLLAQRRGRASTSDVEQALRCSAPTARAILETLDKLGIGQVREPGAAGAGDAHASDEPFRWLLDAIERKRTP